MSKVYKSKDKLIVYLPDYLINGLGLKEGDEISFTKGTGGFVVAKKSVTAASIPQAGGPSVSQDELAVLRKLDSVKYSERTKEKLKQILNQNERKVLVGLIKRKLVSGYKKAGEQSFKYGIAKSVYNKYLFGKREASRPQQKTVTIQMTRIVVPEKPVDQKKWEQRIGGSNTYLETLEQNGFLVVANQAEASAISSELEQSIRTGQVIGTRAFNRKYYITLRSFVNKNAPKIIKAIGTKSVSVSDISKSTGVDEEGIRAILYILAEGGDVTEARRDVFKVVA